MFASKEPMLAADRVRMSAQADVMFSRKWMRPIFQGLAERRAAMSLAVQSRAEVKVSIDIDDADFSSLSCVTEKMAVSSFVAAAQDNRRRPALQDRRDDVAEHALGVFQ